MSYLHGFNWSYNIILNGKRKTYQLTSLKSYKTGNVCVSETMRRVCVTVVGVEKQEMLRVMNVCSFAYPTRSEHAPFYPICGLT